MAWLSEGVVPAGVLTAEMIAEIEQLAKACNAADGLDLPLNLEPEPPDSGQSSQWLVYRGGRLAGFCSIFGGREVEACGMVDPSVRRHGIGSALLDAVLAECRSRGASSALLIVEQGSASGQGFASAMDLPRAFSEHRMERPLTGQPQTRQTTVRLEQAGAAEIETLVAVTAAVFGDDVEATRERIAAMITRPAERFFLAYQESEPVGVARIENVQARRFIYGFGVLPEWRRRGIGSQILNTVFTLLGREDATMVALEVETTNEPAVALYRSCGFEIARTFDYFTLEPAG